VLEFYIVHFSPQFLLIFNWFQYAPMQLGSYVYPIWADMIGWCLSLAPVLAVPVMMVKQLIGASKGLSFKQVGPMYNNQNDLLYFANVQKFCHLLKPDETWGPAHQICSMSAKDALAMKTIHGPEEKKLSSFDNPSFSMTFPVENAESTD
jgi:hypothetical protein